METHIDADAYSLAVLVLCTPYYSVNHGTVFGVGRMTFITIWSRIAESASSSDLGVLAHRKVSGRASGDYSDWTRVHDSRPSLRTSRGKAHLVAEMRRRLSLMYSHTMGGVLDEDDGADGGQRHVVEHVTNLSQVSPSFYHPIVESGYRVSIHRNGPSL